jgi:hypothetical protein
MLWRPYSAEIVNTYTVLIDDYRLDSNKLSKANIMQATYTADDEDTFSWNQRRTRIYRLV